MSQAGHSPLTEELLAPGEDVTTILDYQYDTQEDPEIVQAVLNIPPCTDMVDVEMEDVNAPLGFKPKVGHSGYDVNLIHIRTTLRWAQFLWLWHKKVRCWTMIQLK